MRASISLFGACAIALMLCGCNEAGPVASVPPPRPAAAGFAGLPPGEACSRKITRYQSVAKSDAATGNLAQQVYLKIEQDLQQAAAACAAGQNGEALRLVNASEERHGYHV